MRIVNLIEHHLSASRSILKESCDGLTIEQQQVVEGVYKGFLPLIEATLTAQQIQQLFGSVEKAATAGGDNRTGLGLGVDVVKTGADAVADVAKQANKIINDLGKYLQDTTPVKMADQKFEQLKAKVGAKFPELDKQLTGLGSWMKENPGKSAAIIGVLTALASLAGGPVGGAVAGQVLRGAAELIKGEKLSSAVGKGVKTAAYGYMAGWLLDGLGDWLEGLRAEVVPYDKLPGLVQLEVGLSKTLSMGGTTVKDTIYKVIVPEDLSGTMMATINQAKGGDIDAFNELLSFSRNFSRSDYLASKGVLDAAAKTLALQNDSLFQGLTQASNAITAAAQGSIAGKMTASDVKVAGKPIDGDKAPAKESRHSTTRSLSEGQVYLVLNRVCAKNNLLILEGKLQEGPMDFVKNIASKGMDKLKTVGANLTTKVTADKLNSAWQKAGSPTETNELAAFLAKQGVAKNVIDSVYKELKIQAPDSAMPQPGKDPAKADTVYAQIKNDVQKLDKKSQKQMMAYLQKQLGTA